MAKKKNVSQENETQEEILNGKTEKNEKPEKTAEAKDIKNEDKSQELQKLQDELKEEKSKFLRLAAEYDNYRKRTVKEKEQAYSDAKASVIKDLLPVIDNFSRAGISEASELEPFKKGMEMIYDQFTSVLTSLGVETFGEKGDAFEPLLHNAVMRAENSELPENTLAEVFSKGYKLGDRIIRCADVQVAN